MKLFAMTLVALSLVSTSAFAASSKVCGEISLEANQLVLVNSETYVKLIIDTPVSERALRVTLNQNNGSLLACVTGITNDDQTQLLAITIDYRK